MKHACLYVCVVMIFSCFVLLGLHFTVYGAAECHWTETREHTTGTGNDRKTTRETIHFNGKDVYLNTRTYLFGGPGSEAREYPSGTHRYDFTSPLPESIPASMDASLGSIRYHVKAVLDVPWSIDDEFKVAFTVVRHDNLNNFPDLRLACRSEEIKTFCCCCCQSDPLIATVTLPQGVSSRKFSFP